MKDGVILILLIVIALMAVLGRDHAGPTSIIQDVSDKFRKADWHECRTIGNGPITAPPPGKVRTDYRDRDGGVA